MTIIIINSVIILQELASYDHVTNKTWKEVTRVITENFDEADNISDNSEVKKFTKKYILSSRYATKQTSFAQELIEYFVGNTSKMEIMGVFGSSMEGGMFSVFNFNSSGDYEFDFDVMVGFGPQPLSQHQQNAGFRHLPDKPGHLIIDISEMNNWEMDPKYLKKNSGIVYVSGLEVKKEFAILETLNVLKNVQVYIDSDPNKGRAAVSINIEINSTQALSMECFYRPIYDKMLNISATDDEDQERLDKIWQGINFESLFKKTIIHIDLVPSIECESWPLIAEEWKTRNRLWPPKSLINKIIQGGHHVVAKASPGGDTDLEWRLSFSKAELTLAENRNKVQKICYYIFKTMFKEYLRKSGVISTYYLKTIMMWAMEQYPVEYWREDNIGQAVIGLLDDLYQAVVTGDLPHYFIPQNNLLKHVSCDILEIEAREILLFRKSFMDINRQEPVLLSLKAEGTPYESVMRVSRKRFKIYHAQYIEYMFKNRLSCIENIAYTSHGLHCHYPVTQPENTDDLFCTLSWFDILEAYLIGEYPTHTELIKTQINKHKETIKSCEMFMFNNLLKLPRHLHDLADTYISDIRMILAMKAKMQEIIRKIEFIQLNIEYGVHLMHPKKEKINEIIKLKMARKETYFDLKQDKVLLNQINKDINEMTETIFHWQVVKESYEQSLKEFIKLIKISEQAILDVVEARDVFFNSDLRKKIVKACHLRTPEPSIIDSIVIDSFKIYLQEIIEQKGGQIDYQILLDKLNSKLKKHNKLIINHWNILNQILEKVEKTIKLVQQKSKIF